MAAAASPPAVTQVSHPGRAIMAPPARIAAAMIPSSRFRLAGPGPGCPAGRRCAWRYEPTGSRSGYTAALMSDALATSSDRRTALAHFVLQMSPHDAELLQQALDQAHRSSGEGEAR